MARLVASASSRSGRVLAVEAGGGLAPGQGLGHQHVDGDAVLGVHHDRGPVGPGLLHGPEDLAVGRVEDAGVGHEQLEARHPLVDEHVHLLARLFVDVRHDHVEAVVDGAVALRFGQPGVEPGP